MDGALARHRHDGLAEALHPLTAAASPQWLAGGPWDDVNGALEYARGGLPARIVDRPADDAVSRGMECEGDDAKLMRDEWSRLDVLPLFADALRFAFRDGSAAILVLCEDGPSLAEPLREDRLGAATALRPLSGAQLSAGPFRYADPAHVRYGQPTTYRVRGLDGGGDYEVHETRLLRVPGEPMAPEIGTARRALPWAGRPRLGGEVGKDLRRYRDGLAWLLKLLERKQQPVHAADGLTDQLAAADALKRDCAERGVLFPAEFDAYNIVRARARQVDLTRGTLATVVVDGKDRFEVMDLGLSGTGEVIREFKTAICASSEMPFLILFGEAASGLNAGDKGTFESYHGLLERIRNRQVRPAAERLTALLWRQEKFRAQEPERWRITFPALWSPTEAETAETAERRARARKADADAVAVLQDSGVASPEEVRAAYRAVIPEWGLSDGPVPDTPDDDTGDADPDVERIGGPEDGATRRLPALGVDAPPGGNGAAVARSTTGGVTASAAPGASAAETPRGTGP